VRIGHISEINHFVTDAVPPPGLRRICEEHGVLLDVAADDGHEARASA
jgi:DeoR/GlpR family transcriptional regulator of sugar metabolism